MQREFVDPIFDFCQSMAKLNLDEAEYALLVAINTFSTGKLCGYIYMDYFEIIVCYRKYCFERQAYRRGIGYQSAITITTFSLP